MKQEHTVQIELSQHKIDQHSWTLELEKTYANNIQVLTILDCATTLDTGYWSKQMPKIFKYSTHVSSQGWTVNCFHKYPKPGACVKI